MNSSSGFVLPHRLSKITAALRDTAGAEPWSLVQRILSECSAVERDDMTRFLEFLPGRGSPNDQAFYRCERLSFLKVVLDEGAVTSTHDHGTWGVVMVLAGTELNTLFEVNRATGHLGASTEVRLRVGEVLAIPQNLAHKVEVVGTDQVVGLHVYGGDLSALVQRVW